MVWDVAQEIRIVVNPEPGVSIAGVYGVPRTRSPGPTLSRRLKASTDEDVESEHKRVAALREHLRKLAMRPRPDGISGLRPKTGTSSP